MKVNGYAPLLLRVNTPEVVSSASDLKKLALSIESRVVALTLVKFAPLAAGNVDGKRASGIVPEVKLFALKLVRSIVCHDPSPLKKLELEAVPLPSLAVATVPEAKFDAFNAVKVEPSPINVLPLAT